MAGQSLSSAVVAKPRARAAGSSALATKLPMARAPYLAFSLWSMTPLPAVESARPPLAFTCSESTP